MVVNSRSCYRCNGLQTSQTAAVLIISMQSESGLFGEKFLLSDEILLRCRSQEIVAFNESVTGWL